MLTLTGRALKFTLPVYFKLIAFPDVQHENRKYYKIFVYMFWHLYYNKELIGPYFYIFA